MGYLTPVLFAAAPSVLSTAPAYADLGDQLFKLLPDDGAMYDFFGLSVAISGATAVVGSYQHDDNGPDSGAVYLFDTPAGLQIAKLLPDDGAAFDRFGISVAISVATAIIGAFADDENGSVSGSAYLFDTTTGRQIAKLLPNDGAADDRFGHSVAISGATAIVGAWWDDDACPGDPECNSGSAYLFDAAGPGKCPWDLNDDGVVGASDLLALLVSWGPCKGCPADFDGDGNVGEADLFALLVNWGPCP